jgi:mono/diheme cytochrome c family protein
MWAVLALVALAVLAFAIRHEYYGTQSRFAPAVALSPTVGEGVFRDKGCSSCHAANVLAGKLGDPAQHADGLPGMVTAMWNHAPRMWEAMDAQRVKYPELSYEETGQLISYLYVARWVDESGDPARGAKLFSERNCSRCHGEQAGATGPGIKQLARSTDLVLWTQSLWNHASSMRSRMKESGIAWPRLEANDLRDLFSYVRRDGSDAHTSISRADASRGWQVFQSKGCVQCHSISRGTAGTGADLGPNRPLPPTYSQFAAAMLNHFPAMQRANGEASELPTFRDGEMADVTVFIYSLHYLEPSGSPQVGASVFAWRGCNSCHGEAAEGTAKGPSLRGRGQSYTSVRLATDLWRHGSRMYSQTRNQRQPWPALQPSDVGDLLWFLNTPLPKR